MRLRLASDFFGLDQHFCFLNQQAIENNIYSAIKMRKGHRRTQSDIIHITQKCTPKSVPPQNEALSHHQITKLLNICSQKVQQKVSNVEVLSQPNQNSYLVFRFGQNSHKKCVLLTQNDADGDYLACIPERKQSAYQECEETNPKLVKKIQHKDRAIEQVFEQKFRRLPFSDALNSKPRERRNAEPEKLRQDKGEIRNRLGLKLKP